MDKTWQLQDAKSHFSEVVERATKGETQIVTKHGKKAAVVLAYDTYLELKQQKTSLLEVLRTGPAFDLELERSKDTGRQVDL